MLNVKQPRLFKRLNNVSLFFFYKKVPVYLYLFSNKKTVFNVWRMLVPKQPRKLKNLRHKRILNIKILLHRYVFFYIHIKWETFHLMYINIFFSTRDNQIKALVRLIKRLKKRSRKFVVMLKKRSKMLLIKWWRLSRMLKLNVMKIIVSKIYIYIFAFFFWIKK